MGTARPEAAFYRWRALAQEQRRVAAAVQSWLAAFSTMPIPTRATGNSIFDWQQIDETRASNVIVIDGPRGAGKTSLMLTLVELWRRTLAQDKLEEVFAPIPAVPPRPGETDLLGIGDVQPLADVPPASDHWTIETRTSFDSLRSRIIPIRVLDFAPLPYSTSLVTWVAAQLREFIDLLDQRTTAAFSDVSTRAVVPWEPDWDKELPSRRAWAELTASAAWGWDDNIQARKGTLDPDAYAEELQQSERARVGIVERWRTLIGAIVKDAAQRYRGRISEEARIVIPIDDVDMNPQRTAGLLDFVHTFWDPQLVFLLSGDSKLILAALEQHHAKALGMTGGDASDAGFSRREIAAQSYDKVVPLAQRFRIGPLTPAERVKMLEDRLSNLQGIGSTGPSGTSDAASKPMPLTDVLRMDRWAAEALPATLREIHDMRQKLSGHMKITDVVADIWSDAVSREALTVDDRKRISERVDLSQDGMPSVEAEIDARAERLGEFRVPSSSQGSSERRAGRTHLVLEGISALVPCDMPGSSRLRGALLLAADLAADDPDAAWSAISIAGRGYKCPAVRARVVVSIAPQHRSAGNHAEELLRRGVRWPVPNWPAPIDLARFAEEWRKLIPGILERRQAPGRDREVAIRFLDLIRSVQMRSAPLVVAPELKQLMKEIFEHRIPETSASPRDQAYVDWARGRALLLAAPESGLHVDTANDLLSVLPGDATKGVAPQKGAAAQKDVATPLFVGIHRARFERVRISLETLPYHESPDGYVDATLTAIDASFPGHPWVERFRPWKPEHAPQEVR